MARVELALPHNAEGDFFVDSSCIDCDACRQIAPTVFAESDDQSFVARQPADATELLAAEQALLSCPTASIGTRSRHDFRAAIESLPTRLHGEVYFCGYTSESSFGAWSYLVRRESGNLLIDSPRFTGRLAKRIGSLGGVARILLTHRDDVADHEKFHAHFGASRVLHRDDVTSRTAAVELQPGGGDPVELEPGVMMIPTPGHTRGHAVYLVDNRYLFTGDHLAWSPRREGLIAFRSACWYSWPEQIRSMERLLDFEFQWVIPGHGRIRQLQPGSSRQELERCIAWMKGA
jgi:glyoxylase-like metal-dependent hydrolase (beta-lactamase superfamily II)/ferredoxin